MSSIASLARPEILRMKGYESARSTAGSDGILLNANEAPRTLIQNPEWASLELNRYPVPQPEKLISRFADLYGVAQEQILVTRGSDEGIDLLLRVFCNAGQDAIIECAPCFGMYRIAATIQAAKIFGVPRNVDDLRINFDALCAAIENETAAKLVFLTSPNNPTGDLIAQSELDRVLRACGQKKLLVLDEAYIEFCDSESAARLLDQWPNLVVLRTLSKAWGAAGLRCGSVLASEEIIGLLRRVMAPYPLTAPAISAALTITAEDSQQAQSVMLAEIASEKRALIDALQTLGWIEKVWAGEANFVLMRVDDAPGLVTFCAEKGIRIRDFSQQDLLDNCVRLSIGSPEEMAILKATLGQYGDNS